MGYNIIRSEINMTAASCLGSGRVIEDNLSKIRESLNNLIENENFTGNGADAIKQYLYFVHLTAIDSIIVALEEFYSLAAQYAAGFSDYDSFDEAVINEDYLTEIIEKMKAMLLSMEEAQNDPFNAEDGVMDLLPDRILKLLWAYQDPLENEKTKLKNLRDGIATYDADFKANKFQNIRELLAESERLVNLIKEKEIVTFEGMNPAHYFTEEQYEKILGDIGDSYTYLLENKDKIQNDVQFVSGYVEKVREREKKEAKKQRIEKGIILILSGTIAIGSVVLTVGTSGPLFVECVWTAGATYIAADSTAKSIEGLQEIYYGLNDDFETPSFNGVRDGIFKGNQKYYDTANLIIYSGFQCTGSYKNIYTAGSKALENGASVELAKITASGEEMFKAGVGSLADFTGEKLAKSCSDDMLAQFVIQTTFSFGVQKGTDKAAKSFGKGFSNKMSKYVGKAGTTSTISGPKIGDANIDMPETFKVKEPEVHSESPMFGEDWNSFFREKYGEGNVTWESAPEGHIDNPNTITYKTFEKETFSSGFDYESMYEHQYLDDFSYEEHFAGGDIEGITTKDPSGINNQEISYASFEGEYEPIKLKSKDYYPESPMSGEDWNKYFQDKYGSKNVSWETGSVGKETVDVIRIGKNDLDVLRKKLGVPEIDTIAIDKTDVKGLENNIFEGESPNVRKEAGLPDLDEIWKDRNIKYPGNNPLFSRHAEEVVVNQFDKAVMDAGINPTDVKGVLKIHQSNPTGVCRKCYQGLANNKVKPGILKQLSLKYPNLRIEITSEIVPGVEVTGRSELIIQNGQYVK